MKRLRPSPPGLGSSRHGGWCLGPNFCALGDLSLIYFGMFFPSGSLPSNPLTPGAPPPAPPFPTPSLPSKKSKAQLFLYLKY